MDTLGSGSAHFRAAGLPGTVLYDSEAQLDVFGSLLDTPLRLLRSNGLGGRGPRRIQALLASLAHCSFYNVLTFERTSDRHLDNPPARSPSRVPHRPIDFGQRVKPQARKSRNQAFNSRTSQVSSAHKTRRQGRKAVLRGRVATSLRGGARPPVDADNA